MRSAGLWDGAPACITLTSLDCRPGNPPSDLAIPRHAAVTGVCVDAAGQRGNEISVEPLCAQER